LEDPEGAQRLLYGVAVRQIWLLGQWALAAPHRHRPLVLFGEDEQLLVAPTDSQA
jgi:hypothetical protein